MVWNSTSFLSFTTLIPNLPCSSRDNIAGDILWADTAFPCIKISAETPSLILLSKLGTLISTLKVLVFLSADVAIKETFPFISLPEISFAVVLEPNCT